MEPSLSQDEHSQDEPGQKVHGQKVHGQQVHGQDEHCMDEHGMDEHGGDENGRTPGGAPPPAAAPQAVRQLLSGSPREVLARIVPGDPLRVRDAVARAVREQAVLLDADRVHLRALALVARAAPRWAGRPALGAWLATQVEAAIEEVLREDAEAAQLDAGGAFEQLARPLALDPDALRRGCAAFNRLAQPERSAFFQLVLLGRALDDVARERGESASAVARSARRALDVVLHANHPDLPPPRPAARRAVPGTSAATATASEERP